MNNHHNDGMLRKDLHEPIPVCESCGRDRSFDQPDTPCPERIPGKREENGRFGTGSCKELDVMFLSYYEARAEAKGWT